MSFNIELGDQDKQALGEVKSTESSFKIAKNCNGVMRTYRPQDSLLLFCQCDNSSWPWCISTTTSETVTGLSFWMTSIGQPLPLTGQEEKLYTMVYCNNILEVMLKLGYHSLALYNETNLHLFPLLIQLYSEKHLKIMRWCVNWSTRYTGNCVSTLKF